MLASRCNQTITTFAKHIIMPPKRGEMPVINWRYSYHTFADNSSQSEVAGLGLLKTKFRPAACLKHTADCLLYLWALLHIPYVGALEQLVLC